MWKIALRLENEGLLVQHMWELSGELDFNKIVIKCIVFLAR